MLWKKDGKLRVDAIGKPKNCPECPCGDSGDSPCVQCDQFLANAYEVVITGLTGALCSPYNGTYILNISGTVNGPDASPCSFVYTAPTFTVNLETSGDTGSPDTVFFMQLRISSIDMPSGSACDLHWHPKQVPLDTSATCAAFPTWPNTISLGPPQSQGGSCLAFNAIYGCSGTGAVATVTAI